MGLPVARRWRGRSGGGASRAAGPGWEIHSRPAANPCSRCCTRLSPPPPPAGKTRNMTEEDKVRYAPRAKRFDDDDVCKPFLCGFCPYEEFRRTKNDAGDCPHEHDEACKAAWEALEEAERGRYGYEEELLKRFHRLVADLRARIAKNSARLEMADHPLFLAEDQVRRVDGWMDGWVDGWVVVVSSGWVVEGVEVVSSHRLPPHPLAPLLPSRQKRLDGMAEAIKAAVADAERLGEEGDVDTAQAAVAHADRLRADRAAFENVAAQRGGANATKGLQQDVCQVSGLIIQREESRMAEHHSGRNFK